VIQFFPDFPCALGTFIQQFTLNSKNSENCDEASKDYHSSPCSIVFSVAGFRSEFEAGTTIPKRKTNNRENPGPHQHRSRDWFYPCNYAYQFDRRQGLV
jgi:hypothetical protein